MEDEVQALDIAGRAYSVAFCDLDHFKDLNDTHGHATGDRALRLFAETLTDSMRPNALAARWGGEEFVIVVPDNDAPAAAAIIDRLREQLALALMNATLPRFTFSAGVAESIHSFERTTAVADAALLDAKDNGRDCVIVATSGSHLTAGATGVASAESEMTGDSVQFEASEVARG